MASPAEPVTTEPTGALFRALRTVDVEPNLAYEAAEENRRRTGESGVAVLGAKIDAQGARIKAHRRSTACDLAADRSAGRPRLRPALQGSHYRPWLRSGPLRWAFWGGCEKMGRL